MLAARLTALALVHQPGGVALTPFELGAEWQSQKRSYAPHTGWLTNQTGCGLAE